MGRPHMINNPQPQRILLQTRNMAGVQNQDILIDVYEEYPECDEGFESITPVLKLNRLTILAYCKIDGKVWKLWTSGGFTFYTTNDTFLGEKNEEGKESEVQEGDATKVA